MFAVNESNCPDPECCSAFFDLYDKTKECSIVSDKCSTYAHAALKKVSTILYIRILDCVLNARCC